MQGLHNSPSQFHSHCKSRLQMAYCLYYLPLLAHVVNLGNTSCLSTLMHRGLSVHWLKTVGWEGEDREYMFFWWFIFKMCSFPLAPS